MTEPVKGNSGSLFARPLKPHISEAPVGNTRTWIQRPASGLALAGLMSATCAVLLLQSRPDGAQNLPSAQKRHASRSARRVQVALAEGTTHETAKAGDAARPSLEFYTRGVRDSLFSAPQPPKQKEVTVPKPARVIVPVIKPLEVNPFADWSYAGTVTVGDKKMALLENRISKEGQYVREGQNFFGAQVKSVTDQMVTVLSVGKPYRLAKSDEINLTPLNNSAAYLTPPTQQASQANAIVEALQKGLKGQADMSGPGMVLPNGRALTADQTARFNSRMNRRFNGGGGPGGGGGQGGQGGGGRGGRGGRGGGPGGFGQGGPVMAPGG